MDLTIALMLTYIGSTSDVTPLRPEQDVLEVQLDVVGDVRHLEVLVSNLKTRNKENGYSTTF